MDLDLVTFVSLNEERNQHSSCAYQQRRNPSWSKVVLRESLRPLLAGRGGAAPLYFKEDGLLEGSKQEKDQFAEEYAWTKSFSALGGNSPPCWQANALEYMQAQTVS